MRGGHAAGHAPAMPSPVLILTAGFGEGHNAAARALAAGCDDLQGPGTARVADVFALSSPRLNDVSRRAYLGIINRLPRVWSRAYAYMDRSKLLPRTFTWMGGSLRQLARIVREEEPRVICSTYPVYAFLVERLRREGRIAVPHFNVVTDSISINSLWWRADCAGWFLPNEDTAQVLRQAGLDPARLRVHGFPVNLDFDRPAGEFDPPDLAAGARPRVLMVVNSGSRHAAATAHRLLAEEDWDITCAVGRDHRLRGALQAAAAARRHPARILGWTDEIPRLLMTHHAVISKAGGATTQEAIAARCPMIVSQIVPGQEEGNYELLRRHGVGALGETPAAAIGALRAAFANGGAVWRDWRAAVAPLSRPDAARVLAAQLLAAAGLARPPPHPAALAAAQP